MEPDKDGFRFIGRPVRRAEDERLVTGKGRFSDDFKLDHQAYAAVAMVVAETLAQALDGAEAVEVDYEVLPHVTHAQDAMTPGAPKVWDEVTDNIPVETWFGDRAATDRAFTAADHVVKMDFHIGRVTGVPLERRGKRSRPDAAGRVAVSRWYLQASSEDFLNGGRWRRPQHPRKLPRFCTAMNAALCQLRSSASLRRAERTR